MSTRVSVCDRSGPRYINRFVAWRIFDFGASPSSKRVCILVHFLLCKRNKLQMKTTFWTAEQIVNSYLDQVLLANRFKSLKIYRRIDSEFSYQDRYKRFPRRENFQSAAKTWWLLWEFCSQYKYLYGVTSKVHIRNFWMALLLIQKGPSSERKSKRYGKGLCVLMSHVKLTVMWKE